MKKYKIEREEVLARMIESNFSGYDPSAFNFSNRAIKIRAYIGKLPTKILRKVISSLYARVIYYLGGYSAYILRPEKKIYAKGISLVLSGLSYDDKLNEELVSDLVSQLLEMKLEGRHLWAHDLDYSFPGGKSVTTRTPNLVTTAFVANAFFDLYEKTKNEKYKEIFGNIVLDILNEIPYRTISEDKICFMYTPVTDYYVHNANLLYSEILSKSIYLGMHHDKGLINLIEKSLNYSISDFNKTSTYPYAGPPTPKLAIDNYHTGYLLRSLKEINHYVGYKLSLNLEAEILRLLDFYISYFIREGYVLRDHEGTIQSHSLAESILVFKGFKNLMSPENKKMMLDAIDNTLPILYESRGHFFINNAKKIGPLFIKDKTEMIRWSNAWMFYSLSVEL